VRPSRGAISPSHARKNGTAKGSPAYRESDGAARRESAWIAPQPAPYASRNATPAARSEAGPGSQSPAIARARVS